MEYENQSFIDDWKHLKFELKDRITMSASKKSNEHKIVEL